jgi:hypothetical protein
MIYIDIMVIKENRKHNGFLNEWINSGFNFNIEDRLHFTPLSFFLNSIDPKEFNNYSEETFISRKDSSHIIKKKREEITKKYTEKYFIQKSFYLHKKNTWLNCLSNHLSAIRNTLPIDHGDCDKLNEISKLCYQLGRRIDRIQIISLIILVLS